MVKYLKQIYDGLSALKSGIQNNSGQWTGQPDTPASVQADMDAIKDIDDKIKALKTALKLRQQQAKALAADLKTKVEASQNRARGIHAAEPQKLREYNIAVENGIQKRTVPLKGQVEFVKYDTDGEGFKLKAARLEQADFYEWQRGVLPDGQSTVMQPPFPHWCSVRKQKVTDNEVQRGVRYFYRVRGVNSAGPGEWSEPVSGIQ